MNEIILRVVGCGVTLEKFLKWGGGGVGLGLGSLVSVVFFGARFSFPEFIPLFVRLE